MFTRTAPTNRGGWSNRPVTNLTFAIKLAEACTATYGRRFSSDAERWTVNPVTGVVRCLEDVGEGRQLWSYIGRMTESHPHPHRFLADADTNSGCCDHGIYFNGQGSLNGVFQGSLDVCFTCAGKGYTTPEDDKRNRYYWNHKVISI